MHLIIRSDASPTIGTGHVMRCLALAQWAKKLGIACTLMGRIQVPWVEERLAKESIDFFPLLGEIPKQENHEELMQSLAAAPQNSWVVLDGYHFTLECQKAVQAAGHKLLVIDDYAHLPEYSCDILLNQNINAEKLKYNGNIGQQLLGLEYVLLRQEFIEAREKAKNRTYSKTPQNILLTLGGGDFSKHLYEIAPYFTIPEMQGKTLCIIKGAMQKESILNTLQSCPAKIDILENVHNMPDLLLNTDLCISAGGSTCWELCCLGVPFLTVEIAENQHDIVVGLDARNVARHLGDVSLQEALTTKMYESILQQIKTSPIDGNSLQRLTNCMREM